MSALRHDPGPEHWVDRHQLAAIMGVSASTIYRWTLQGMPSALWGQRIRRYRPSQCVAWACTNVCDNDRIEK